MWQKTTLQVLLFGIVLLFGQNATAQQGWVREHLLYNTTPSAAAINYYYSSEARITPCTDGGYVSISIEHQPWSLSDSTNVVLLKTNATGAIEWKKKIYSGATYYDHRYADVLCLTNGQLIVAFANNNLDTNAYYRKFELYQFNLDGTLVWQKQAVSQYYFTSINNQIIVDLSPHIDGFLMDIEGFEIIKFNFEGNVLAHIVTNIYFQQVINNEITAANNDSSIILSGFHFAKDSLMVRKYTTDGQVLWDKYFPKLSGYSSNPTDMVVAVDGSIWILRNQNDNATLMKLDENGDILWQKDRIFYIDHNNGVKMMANADGSVTLAGEQLNYNFPAPYTAGSLAKIAPDGTVLWERYYPFRFNNFNDMVAAQDGGYTMVSGHLDAPFYTHCLAHTDSEGLIFNVENVKGRVFLDANDDCLFQPNEVTLLNAKVQLVGSFDWFGSTDSAGLFTINADTGAYTLHLSEPIGSPYLEPCYNDVAIYLPDFQTIKTIDFPVKILADCPWMTVDIGTPILRRCFSNRIYVTYCNKGATDATDVKVEIKFADGLDVTASEIPWNLQNGQTFTFPIGNVGLQECGHFWVDATVNCDSVQLGQTLCMEAHIYPDSFCLPPNPLWSGGSVQVEANCVADSVHFTIKNKGNTTLPNGLEYVVIEDEAIQLVSPIPPLLPLGVYQFSEYSDGNTFRLEAEQVPFHPGFSMPTAWVEGCNGLLSTGFINRFPQDDADDFIETECYQVIGAFDPNDKTGYPLGVGNEQVIQPGVDINYIIRFQNTGNDTAFTIVVRDTLSHLLDAASMRIGASSHPYLFTLRDGGIAEFLFKNILLPDSNVNEVGSHGFLKFQISPKNNLPEGTQIHNNAGIYFDYNAPVVTNTTLHTIRTGLPLTPLSVFTPRFLDESAWISPNPAYETAILRLPSCLQGSFRFKLFDTFGKLRTETIFSNSELPMKFGGFVGGIYRWVLEDLKGEILGNGQIVLF
jgi:uncharacterized repeat protein (TIGR01451 family)